MAATLIIRADAGPQLGTGHLMRALALAEAWRATGGEVRFATCCRLEPLHQRIRAAGAEPIQLDHPHPDSGDLAATLRLLDQAKASGKTHQPIWLALDGYYFDPAYQQAVRHAGAHLLLTDDAAHLPHYHPHVLLNQNLGAERLPYSCHCDTLLVLGSRYALLRPEFRRWRAFRREVPPTARKVLVTLGGADPNNLTATAIAALARLDLPHLEAKVLVGAANPHLQGLRRQLRRWPNVQMLTDVADISELMAWADVAVSAAGITCAELAFMQLPAVLLPIVDNQVPIAQRVAKAHAATNLGRTEQLTAETIARAVADLCRDRRRRIIQAQAGRRLVDGRGADRLVAIMQVLPGTLPPKQVQLRPATAHDGEDLWHLANDPVVRRSSCTSSELIPLESHLRWFRRRLASPGTRIWLLDFHGLVLAQVRYDKTDAQTAEISVAVTSAFRRRGLAARLLDSTIQQASRQLQVRRLRANILEENLPSIRTFIRAGFTRLDSRTLHGHPCQVFEREMVAILGG